MRLYALKILMRQNCKAHNLVNNLLDYMYDGNNDIKLCDGKICDQIKKDTNNVEDIEFYIPEQKDTLFWCFYNAYNKDYLKDKFFTIEKTSLILIPFFIALYALV